MKQPLPTIHTVPFSVRFIRHPRYCIYLIGLIVSLSLCAAIPAHAQQTELDISTATADPEIEFQDELDKWMLRAYEGDRDAQFKVAMLFTNQQFQRPDLEQAVYWYKQAARQGHMLAQYNLGHQYLTGSGVKRNEATAMQWWLKAASQEHALAQFNIGRAYYLGIGLEQDLNQSRFWFERAAQNREPKSIEILTQLGWAEPGQYDSLTKPSVATIIPNANAEPLVTNTQNTNTKAAVDNTDTDNAGTIVEQPSASTDNTETLVAAPNQELVNPVAIYTNPSVRPVLIAILDIRDYLTEVSQNADWTVITSSVGFPVWVHSNFITVADDIGTVTGNAVNARSVPIVTNGTVVGRFKKNETVEVLDKRSDWYRVIAPARFKAWVKTVDYEKPLISTSEVVAKTAEAVAKTEAAAKSEAVASKEILQQASTAKTTNDRPENDNQWLFSQPADHFTLQLASFDDTDKVNEFLSRNKFNDNPKLHQFTSIGKDIEWTYFLYGAFADKLAAQQDKEEIRQKRAWVRSFGQLQQNRCLSWKKQLPSPKELNIYCAQ